MSLKHSYTILIVAFILTLNDAHLQSQHITIIDSLTAAPIPYITIKSTETHKGLIADQHGRIHFPPDFDYNESYAISCIGYKSLTLNGNELIKSDSIRLSANIMTLDEVIIRPISASKFVSLAMTRIDENYVLNENNATAYFKQSLQENKQYLNHCEAWLHVNQPSYLSKDSFEVALIAGECKEAQQLNFMSKELTKSADKAKLKAEKEGKETPDTMEDWSFEVADPILLLTLDPLRHPEAPMHVNESNADFLDSNNHDQYDFWYGKPIMYDGKTIVVIHFDQRKRVKEALFKGTLWIEQDQMAFVKISFGFSERALKHLVPGYAEAIMWVYGLKYDIQETLVEFVYQQFQDRWALSNTTLKAKIFLEKRRFFGENDKSKFNYEAEIVVNEIKENKIDLKHPIFDPEKSLQENIASLQSNPWSKYKSRLRTIQR